MATGIQGDTTEDTEATVTTDTTVTEIRDATVIWIIQETEIDSSLRNIPRRHIRTSYHLSRITMKAS